MIIKPTLPLAAALLITTGPALAAVTTIYQDDFSGTAGEDIHGSAPDIRPGTTETWSAQTAFEFAASGGAFAAELGNNSRAAYLPFVPQSGYLYDYQVTIAFSGTGSQSRSMQMGFFGSDSSSLTGALTGAAANGPVIFLRQAGTYEARAVGSSSLDGFSGTLPGGDPVTNTHTLRITLDTSGTNWFMRTYIGDTEIGSGHTFDTNPTIAAVGISVNTSNSLNASGTFTDFILTSEPIPEPSALVFSAFFAAPLLRRSRRR